MSKRLIWTAGGLAVVFAVAVAVWADIGPGDDPRAEPGWSDNGPVRVPDKHGYIVRYEVGEVFTDGYERVLLTGSRPGTLERVEIVGPNVDHFEMVGVLLAGPDRRTGSVQAYPGFSAHPTYPHTRGLGKLVPAEGATLAPGEVGSVLQIGLKVLKPGLAIRSGVRLYYTVDGEKFTSYQPGAIVVCPEDRTDDECLDALEEAW